MKRPLQALDPLTDFLRDESASGVALLSGAIVALVWANLAGDGYSSFWSSELDLGLQLDLRHWVNDALMALFFFVVGMEIKRELVVGELNSPRTAALPVLAAFGGVLAPALIYVAIVAGGPGASGWAIPVATDIAFAVGVLTLLGSRVPSGVKLFLLAVAVVDDIIAIAVIAAVYASGISLAWLLAALGGLALVVLARLLGVTRAVVYVPLAVAVWVCTYESGVHATIAGVVLGLLTPTGRVAGRELMRDLEHRLHPVSAFVVVPLFALANAGVELADARFGRVAVAIAVGLVVGKLVGIAAATLSGVRLGIGAMPEGMRRSHVWGVAALGGIGFTVSLFVAQLAFEGSALEDQAKVGIFAGSLVSGVLGAALLMGLARRG